MWELNSLISAVEHTRIYIISKQNREQAQPLVAASQGRDPFHTNPTTPLPDAVAQCPPPSPSNIFAKFTCIVVMSYCGDRMR